MIEKTKWQSVCIWNTVKKKYNKIQIQCLYLGMNPEINYRMWVCQRVTSQSYMAKFTCLSKCIFFIRIQCLQFHSPRQVLVRTMCLCSPSATNWMLWQKTSCHFHSAHKRSPLSFLSNQRVKSQTGLLRQRPHMLQMAGLAWRLLNPARAQMTPCPLYCPLHTSCLCQRKAGRMHFSVSTVWGLSGVATSGFTH